MDKQSQILVEWWKARKEARRSIPGAAEMDANF
jgi:hypothetical protein